jgi:hypothetical protein
MGILVLISLVTWVLMRLAPLSTAGCDSRCDYASLSVAVNTYLILDPLIVVLAAVLTLVLWRRGWWAVLPAAVGVISVVIVWWILTELAQTAMLLN